MLLDEPYEIFENIPLTCYRGVCDTYLFLVHQQHEWDALFKVLMRQKFLACDTETNGFKYYDGDKIVGMSFGWSIYHFYCPVRHQDSITAGEQPAQLNMDVIRPDLQRLFSRPDLSTVWSNYRFDRHFYHVDDVQIKCGVHDTLPAWKLLDENAPAALKTVSSGWMDVWGIRHKGLVHPHANKDEKEIKKWREQEAKARKAKYNEDVKHHSALRASELKFQGWKKRDITKWVKENDLADHIYKSVGIEDISYACIPIKDMVKYAALDTFLTLKVHEYCMPRIKDNPKFVGLYRNEQALSNVLFHSEEDGLYVDKEYLEESGRALAHRIASQEASIISFLQKNNINTDDLNLASTDQLINVFQQLGIKLTKKSKSGKKFALDSKVLAKLAKRYPIAKEIINLRKTEKLKDAFIDGILPKIIDGRIHPSFIASGARTGRLSCKEPNCMALPTKDKIIKTGFIVPPGGDYFGLYIDYSQVEVRLTTHYSQDPILISAYLKGEDVHLSSACSMFGDDLSEAKQILKDERHERYADIKFKRQVGKTVNFAIIYGVGAPGLSEQVPIPQQYDHLSEEEWIDQCQQFIDAYFAAHQGVKRFVQRMRNYVRMYGEVETYYGRMRRLPHYNIARRTNDDTWRWAESKAQRQGCNSLIQTTCADIFKVAIVNIFKLLKGTKSRMVNFVHDEISFYIHREDIHLIPKIKAIMEDFDFSVPLVADCSISTTSWANKQEVDGSSIPAILALLKSQGFDINGSIQCAS